jgi:hypothetical protein
MFDSPEFHIPPSFLALYTTPHRPRLTVDRDTLLQRYELCEDMSQMLTTTAGEMQWSLGITENDVLRQCHRGLLGDTAVVSAEEAQWVVSRLAELMGWPLPNW